MQPILSTAQRFIQERHYLKNVTPKTLIWYREAFNHFPNCATKQDYENQIIALRQRGISPVSINCWMRCINAYLRWSNAGFKLLKLKEDEKVLETFSPQQVNRILTHHTKKSTLQRIQVLAAMILDTGLRIEEACSLRRSAVDLDNLLITVMGKGRKERKIPISIEGRKVLYQWLSKTTGDFVFTTQKGLPLVVRNAQRDFTKLCERCNITGVRTSPHTLRHTFAISYLRAGGNVEYLRRILRHSSIVTTQRYLASLGVDDLQAVHDRLSPLAPQWARGGRVEMR